MPPTVDSQVGFTIQHRQYLPLPSSCLCCGHCPPISLLLSPPATPGNLRPVYLYWFSMALLSARSGTQE